jgi:two-component system response regulator AtoC
MNNKTILVADDEPHMRRLIEFTLRKAGFNQFLFAQNGLEALKLIQSEKIDLLIMDQRMPEMNGIDVLTQIKSMPDTSSIPVIMISGCGSFHNELDAESLGAFAVLAKPYSPAFLMREAQRAIESLEPALVA